MKKSLCWGVISGPLLMTAMHIHAQDNSRAAIDEEIVVVGTQIKGAQISDALPVSVINASDIEAIGVNSGDELLEQIVEQGQNFFNQAEGLSGGVNSARGDIGAFNLRNLGTGNTLVLLNGRRMVNAASYQTEEVGGSFVPVNTANSQSLPVTGLERLEILRDGASAIYGADAVAGVVNYVLKKDFEGIRIGVRHDDYESLPRNDNRFTLEAGTVLNGNTRIGAFLNYYEHDAVSASDDPRWANADFRYRTPAPFDAGTTFRNDSINSNFGQYDILSSVSSYGITGTITDSAGEFITRPAGDPECTFTINAEVCGAPDNVAENYRYNWNEVRQLVGDLERINVFTYLEHSLTDDLELFADLTYYTADSKIVREGSSALGAVAKLQLSETAYYNPLGAVGVTSRLPDSIIGTNVPVTGVAMEIDNYRYTQAPRITDVENTTYQITAGLRGVLSEWDWEGAVTFGKAESDDVTKNRVSNTLMEAALNLTTPAAFNPFAPYSGSNIEQALVDVYRSNEQTLAMIDFKISNPVLFSYAGGDVGFVSGVEYRREKFIDDRDPRLDGTIAYVDADGETFPYISDVMGSSPSPDSSGSRKVGSLFAELQIPVGSMLDLQVAIRYEDFSDVGNTTVGKFAFGFRPFEPLLLRGSWSEAFRAPNLVTVNESLVARTNNIDDFVCLYADPSEVTLNCGYGVQRTAQGSSALKPEESDNWSTGFVLDLAEGLTLTFDYWSIEKENTIGLFGEENHIALDLLDRLVAGNSNCAGFVGNPAVVRDPGTIDAATQALYDAAGICAAGDIVRVNDDYANLDERTVKGYDLGIYYDVDTDFGNFNFRYQGTWLDKYEQAPGPLATQLLSAINNGILPSNLPVAGFGDLIRVDGNPKHKDSIQLGWIQDQWSVNLVSLANGDFEQVLSSSDLFPIDSMRTYNINAGYRFEVSGGMDARIRVGINNVTDERAPLADAFFGYYSDVHSDLGRYYFAEFQISLM